METIPGDGDKKAMVSRGLEENEAQWEGSEKALPYSLTLRARPGRHPHPSPRDDQTV
jgi:hypothetical protein